ncbi:unnamed protein product, partial [marine sediment metagenome]
MLETLINLFPQLLLFFASSISALDSLGEFEIDQCVRVVQTCASCSYVN